MDEQTRRLALHMELFEATEALERMEAARLESSRLWDRDIANARAIIEGLKGRIRDGNTHLAITAMMEAHQ